MLDYVILGLEMLVFLWFVSWVYASQVTKIYSLLKLETTKQTIKAIQWEIFVLVSCSAVLFHALLRLLLSPAL